MSLRLTGPFSSLYHNNNAVYVPDETEVAAVIVTAMRRLNSFELQDMLSQINSAIVANPTLAQEVGVFRVSTRSLTPVQKAALVTQALKLLQKVLRAAFFAIANNPLFSQVERDAARRAVSILDNADLSLTGLNSILDFAADQRFLTVVAEVANIATSFLADKALDFLSLSLRAFGPAGILASIIIGQTGSVFIELFLPEVTANGIASLLTSINNALTFTGNVIIGVEELLDLIFKVNDSFIPYDYYSQIIPGYPRYAPHTRVKYYEP